MVLMDLTYYRFCSYLFNYQARGRFPTGQIQSNYVICNFDFRF